MNKIYILREAYLVREDEVKCAITMVTSSFYILKKHIKLDIETGGLLFDLSLEASRQERYKNECAFYEEKLKSSNDLVQKYLDKEAKKDLWYKEPCTKEEYERMKNFKSVNSVGELFEIYSEEEFVSVFNCYVKGATIDVVSDGKAICIKNTI